MDYYNDYDEKIEIIKRSANQEMIIDLARNDEKWNIRRTAVEYIEDEDILKEILNEEYVTAVCITAMQKIEDSDFLADICLNHPDAHLRLACVNRICDESLLEGDKLDMLLERVALNDPDEFVSKSVVENPNFTNQGSLINILRKRDDEIIVREALKKITSEDILSDYALNSSNEFIRREAILNPNMTDFKILSEIIKKDDDQFNSNWACEKIDECNYLLSMIFDESFNSRLSVISNNSNLPFGDYFIDIYENDDEYYHRLVAVYFIDDDRYLNDIVLGESDVKIRCMAVKNRHFKNKSILETLLLNEEDRDIHFEAISKTDDDNLLVSYVKGHLDDNRATLNAILKISDIDFLDELCENENPKIRLQAVKRICKLNSIKKEYEYILKRIVLNNESVIALKAIEGIEGYDKLVLIADGHTDRDVRLSALKRIKPKRLLDNYLFDLYTPVENSLDGLIIQSKLNSIALNDDELEICLVAVLKLNDKSVLDKLINDDDKRVSKAASTRLNSLFEDIKSINQESILKHLIKSSDADVSYFSQKQLEDLKTWRGRIEKVNEISDIDALKEIANDDFNYYVRCEALGKLEKLLFHIRLDEIGEKYNQDRFKEIANDETFPKEIRCRAILNVLDKHFADEFPFLKSESFSNISSLNENFVNCKNCDSDLSFDVFQDKSSKMKCPDCGGSNIAHEDEVYCRDCGLIICPK